MNPSTSAEPKQGRLFSRLFSLARYAPDFPLVARAGRLFACGNHCLKSVSGSKGDLHKGTP